MLQSYGLASHKGNRAKQQFSILVHYFLFTPKWCINLSFSCNAPCYTQPTSGLAANGGNMDTKASPLDFLQQIQQRISAALQNTPAQDIEKNLRALLQQSFGKLDLVTREEFELQRQLVERLRSQVQALETRVAELEQKD